VGVDCAEQFEVVFLGLVFVAVKVFFLVLDLCWAGVFSGHTHERKYVDLIPYISPPEGLHHLVWVFGDRSTPEGLFCPPVDNDAQHQANRFS